MATFPISSLITLVVAIWRTADHVPAYWSLFAYICRLGLKFQLISFLLGFLFGWHVSRAIHEKANTIVSLGSKRTVSKTSTLWTIRLRGYLYVKWAVLCYIVCLHFKWIVFPINRVLCWRIRKFVRTTALRYQKLGTQNFVTHQIR